MNTFSVLPLNFTVRPELGNPHEVEGVLNPAAVRGPDRQLYLFPRMVAEGNYSRIGLMRVVFDDEGDPHHVERLGVALEPEADYELRSDGGGCEDARVTYVSALDAYIMTYTAYSPAGPRIALATSTDLFTWERLGLANFSPFEDLSFQDIDDKDASVFPLAVPNASGQPELAMLHRPLFPGTTLEENWARGEGRTIDVRRESIWISYSTIHSDDEDVRDLVNFRAHHRLASPVEPWESLKIGAGTPPVATHLGWLIVYHGVASVTPPDGGEPRLTYRAGVMVLDRDHPEHLIYRSSHPILTPDPRALHLDVTADVIFPTGIDRRDDIGQPDRFDVYFGMNDATIGAARLYVPPNLPRRAQRDAPGADGDEQ